MSLSWGQGDREYPGDSDVCDPGARGYPDPRMEGLMGGPGPIVDDNAGAS